MDRASLVLHYHNYYIHCSFRDGKSDDFPRSESPSPIFKKACMSCVAIVRVKYEVVRTVRQSVKKCSKYVVSHCVLGGKKSCYFVTQCHFL